MQSRPRREHWVQRGCTLSHLTLRERQLEQLRTLGLVIVHFGRGCESFDDCSLLVTAGIDVYDDESNSVRILPISVSFILRGNGRILSAGHTLP